MFESFREDLYKRQLSNSEAYDKAILSLSSAGLAISLTFIKFVVSIEDADFLIILKSSWILFLLSIVSTVASFLVGNKAIDAQLDNAEKYYIEANRDAYNKFNIYTYLNSFVNYASGVFFVTALTFVVVFVILNINQGESLMSEKKTVVRDSASIPSMQKPAGTGRSTNSATIPSMGEAPGTTTTSQGGSGGSASGGGGNQSKTK